MSKIYIFSNYTNRCSNCECKFVKNHTYPCSDKIKRNINNCKNPYCHLEDGHKSECLFFEYKEPKDDLKQTFETFENIKLKNEDSRTVVYNFINIVNNNLYYSSENYRNT